MCWVFRQPLYERDGSLRGCRLRLDLQVVYLDNRTASLQLSFEKVMEKPDICLSDLDILWRGFRSRGGVLGEKAGGFLALIECVLG